MLLSSLDLPLHVSLGAFLSGNAQTDGHPTHMSRGYSSRHPALDLYVPLGTPVYAPHSGQVITAGQYGEAETGRDCGLTVRIERANVRSALCHNSNLVVSEGEIVHKGQLIAYSGSTGNVTGPHVHWQLMIGGHLVDPVKAVRAAQTQGILIGVSRVAGAAFLLYTLLS